MAEPSNESVAHDLRQPERAQRPHGRFFTSPRPVVLITGSSGLIGRALAERLSGDYRVVGFDREGPPPHPPETVECVCVDLASDESVHKAFERVRYAYGGRLASVVHLAAYYDFSGEPSPKYDQITVRGTARLLKELEGFEVGQIVFSSTMLVHAPCRPGQRIDEDWPLEPKWDYPKSKVTTEELLRRKRGDIPVVILRIAGVYDDRCHSVPLANQLQRIRERTLTSHVFPGDVTHGQAFVHLDDLIDALVAAVERRRTLEPETTLLIGEEETISYDELQRAFGRLLHGEERETKEIPKALAKTGAWIQEHVPGEEPFIKPWMIDLADDHYALDVTRAREALGWEPRRSLEATLPKMAAALKKDPERFYAENKLDGKRHADAQATSKQPTMAMHESAHAGMTLWTHFAVSALGLWEALGAATFPAPAGERWGSLLCGALLFAFGLL